MPNGSPAMIQLLIQYLYTGEYSIGQQLEDRDGFDRSIDPDALETHAQLYALSDYYRISHLKERNSMLSKLALEDEATVHRFPGIVKIIYESVPACACALRWKLFEFAVKNIRSLTDGSGDSIQELMEGAPDLVATVISYVVKEKDNLSKELEKSTRRVAELEGDIEDGENMISVTCTCRYRFQVAEPTANIRIGCPRCHRVRKWLWWSLHCRDDSLFA